MGEAARRGQVTMILRRKIREPNIVDMQQAQQPQQQPQHQHHQHHQPMQREIVYPYDVIVSRNENESFGFVIISASNQYYGSTIGNKFWFLLL